MCSFGSRVRCHSESYSLNRHGVESVGVSQALPAGVGRTPIEVVRMSQSDRLRFRFPMRKAIMPEDKAEQPAAEPAGDEAVDIGDGREAVRRPADGTNTREIKREDVAPPSKRQSHT